MHVINIHAAHMPCMNSRYHCNSLQSIHLLITLTECTQISQACGPTLQQTNGSKVGLSTDKFNKWLKKPYLITKPSTRGTSQLTGTILARSCSGLDLHSSSSRKKPPSDSVGSSKT